ncbi:MAG: PAS domain S-box protein [Victivallales bacterium]|nr:PAS domain S-box protein [Victivallales bacterium]
MSYTKKSGSSTENDAECATFVERIAFPYHSLDSTSRILTTNNYWLELLEYNKDEVIGKNITEFMDEESRPEFEENFKLFIQHTGTFSGQVELFTKHGKPLQFLVDGILDKDSDGNFLRTHCFLRDISSTCRANGELQRLAAKNSAILGAIPEILMEVDVNRVYTWSNQAGFDFFGNNVLDKKADDFFIKDLNNELVKKIEPVLTNEVESINVRSWQQRADGEQRLLSWYCRPTIDEHGNPSGAISSARDITPTHNQNEQIKRLNSILKGIRDINQLINQETDISNLLDGACEKLVGPLGFVSAWAILFEQDGKTVKSISLAGLGSQNLDVFKNRMSSGELTDCAQECLKNRSFVVIAEREQCANCALREFHWKDDKLVNGTLTLPLIVKDKLIGVFASSLPVQHINDAEITTLFHEVIRDIAKAIEKIQNLEELKELRREQAKTGKLESLGVMAGGIAHDFNNVLVGILGNISLAKLDVKADTHLLQYLDSAENAARRARELTQRLLTFAKGGTPIKAAISLMEIIEESVKFLFPDSTIKINIKAPENLKLILGEPSQIQQVLNNLLLNAQEALKETEMPAISITCENATLKDETLNSLEPGEYVKISVADNGNGIGEELKDKVFDPYFSTKQGGNGLGLSSVFSIVKAHDGEIRIESSSNAGTTFSFFIPAAEKKQESSNNKDAETDSDQPTTTEQAKILVMDDEQIVRCVLNEYIKNFGWESDQTEDGAAAVAEYEKALRSEHPYDLVILDLMVPRGMGGLETAEEILKLNPNAKLIVSSGYSEDDAIANFANFGFSAALRKPYAMEELYETLLTVLRS